MVTRGISIFSGAGCMDFGLEQAGLEMAAWVERDRWAQQTLKLNFQSANRALFGDITSVDPDEVRWAASIKKGEVFVLSGAPPCQSWSSAGLRNGFGDSRGRLINAYFDFVNRLRPRFFVFENVVGLATALVPDSGLQGTPRRVLADQVIPTFNALGYETVVGIVNAADYGVAQHRLRLVILGSREQEFSGMEQRASGTPLNLYALMPPSHRPSRPRLNQEARMLERFGWDERYERRRPTWRTLRDALTDLPDGPPEYIRYPRNQASIFGLLPAGSNWTYLRDHGDDLPEATLVRAMGKALADKRGGKTSFWRRLSWDAPCSTLVTVPYSRATGLCHPEEVRPLSVQEYRRIQGLPDNFDLAGPIYPKYRQLANGVPAPLGRFIGQALLKVASKSRSGRNVPFAGVG
jgi:DNA (cytosine-5)-methyltransferase 1